MMGTLRLGWLREPKLYRIRLVKSIMYTSRHRERTNMFFLEIDNSGIWTQIPHYRAKLHFIYIIVKSVWRSLQTHYV